MCKGPFPPKPFYGSVIMERGKMIQQSPEAGCGGVPVMGAVLVGCCITCKVQQGSAGLGISSRHPILNLVLHEHPWPWLETC